MLPSKQNSTDLFFFSENFQEICLMRKPVIAIDGYSSTGKSSISKIIAQKLGLVHLDTGALYRGITYFALKNCLNANGEINLPELFNRLNEIELEFKPIDRELVMFLNGNDISTDIRTNEISQNVSLIASQKEVRDFLLDAQREMAEKGGVIMDGRDIGTVILPTADFKFFLTASVDERTKRRFLELQSLGIETDENTVRENLISRDKTDSEREVAPLRKADDAITIDNSDFTKNETVDLILSYLKDF
ncbi:Cytidylate kinase [Chryseobacterium salivictor]|uniref:Cytidylate kinase n=2 Tax=Chryseobacterium salivictor TaxID=2547600 RepID=A0A4V1ALB6_9FLAO|nr:Cytidylate kinase [Chryseobacterium salivictor]